MLRPYLTFFVFMVTTVCGCLPQSNREKDSSSRDFKFAEYYDYYGRRDSAFYYYNRVVATSPDSLEKATAYFKMGLRLLEAGDYFAAQESLISSIKTLNENDNNHFSNISAAYNTLGNATLALKDYKGAIEYFKRASKFAANGDPRLYIMNNLGVAYQKEKDYRTSIEIFDSAGRASTTDTSLKAKLISNLSRTRWLSDSSFAALPQFLYALALRSRIRDSAGMNASLSHLSDYYARTRPDSALFYAKEWLDLAQKRENPETRLEALNQFARLSSPAEATSYLRQYLKLNDSLNEVRSRDRNQYALIRFDAEKNKADNLLLHKHVSEQRRTIIATFVGTIMLVAGLILWARMRRVKLKRTAENELKEIRLRTSQKIHDVVANGLYRVMNELEHRPDVDKEELLNRIESLYEKSRDISYETSVNERKELMHRIHDLIMSFSNDETNMIIIGEPRVFWTWVKPSQAEELELVLQELLVNMQKHSRARNVSIHLIQEQDTARIRYNDDGVGFAEPMRFGNGLTNTVNRIKSIHGEISFAKNSGKGMSILISFPVKSDNDR